MVEIFKYIFISAVTYYALPDLWLLVVITVFFWVLANESQLSWYRPNKTYHNFFVADEGFLICKDDKLPYHKQIIENKIGRRMDSDETVIYKDGNFFNLNANNLELKKLDSNI